MSETQVTQDTIVENNDDLDAFGAEFFGEKKAPEPAAKQAEVEQDEEATDDTVEETDAQKTDTEVELTEYDEKEAEAELAKPKSKVQERIDELVKQKHDAERAADAKVEALRKEFEEKLAALQPKPVEQKANDEPLPDAVNDDGTEKYPLGEFDPSFIRDLTRYTLTQERNQAIAQEQANKQAQEQTTQQAALKATWDEKMTPAKERYPDLVEKGTALLKGFDNLDSGYAEYLSTVLMSMDFGPDVLYYLSNNPDEATKIVNSGAQKATLALGRIEAKFAEADATKQLAKPRVSKAPPPPSATARGNGGSGPTIAPDTDDLDAFTDEFFKGKRRK